MSSCLVAQVVEQGKDTLAEVALDDDLPILDATSHTALDLELPPQLVEVGVGTDKVVDDGDRLASATATLHPHMQFLLIGRKRFNGRFLIVLVLVVGIGGIDHPHFVLILHDMVGRNVDSGVTTCVTWDATGRGSSPTGHGQT